MFPGLFWLTWDFPKFLRVVVLAGEEPKGHRSSLVLALHLYLTFDTWYWGKKIILLIQVYAGAQCSHGGLQLQGNLTEDTGPGQAAPGPAGSPALHQAAGTWWAPVLPFPCPFPGVHSIDPPCRDRHRSWVRRASTARQLAHQCSCGTKWNQRTAFLLPEHRACCSGCPFPHLVVFHGIRHEHKV